MAEPSWEWQGSACPSEWTVSVTISAWSQSGDQHRAYRGLHKAEVLPFPSVKEAQAAQCWRGGSETFSGLLYSTPCALFYTLY